MTEITDFGAIILIVTAGFAVAALSTSLTERVRVPTPAIFLIAAAVVSDIWPRIYDRVPIETVERISFHATARFNNCLSACAASKRCPPEK